MFSASQFSKARWSRLHQAMLWVACCLVLCALGRCSCAPSQPKPLSEPRTEPLQFQEQDEMDGGTRTPDNTPSDSAPPSESQETIPERPVQEEKPEQGPNLSGYATEAPGAFRTLLKLVPLSGGRTAVLAQLKGKASFEGTTITPPPGAHVYLLLFDARGRLVRTKRLISSPSHVGSRFQMATLGSHLAIATLERPGVLDPEGQKVTMLDTGRHFVFRVRLKDMRFHPAVLELGKSATVTAIAGNAQRWFIGGTVRFGELRATVAGQTTTRKPKNREANATMIGNAYLLELTEKGEVKQPWMLDGSGSSSVHTIIPTQDGLFVTGGIGGFGRGKVVSGIFDLGLPTEKTITGESSDDDPAWDVYVAKLNTAMRLDWARLILAYYAQEDRASTMVPFKDGVALFINKSGYDLVASRGEKDERREKEEGIIAYNKTGKLTHYFRISEVTELVSRGKSLLVHGQIRRTIPVGTQSGLTIPAPSDFGAAAGLVSSYTLVLDENFAASQIATGAWAQVQGSNSLFRLTRRVAASGLVYLMASSDNRVVIEQGSPTQQAYGKDKERRMILLKWPLRHK